MPENINDTMGPVLTTLVAVEFGSRVAVIGDERRVEQVIDAGKAVRVVTADGPANVKPGTRWVKRNGATRFSLKGETGHGPRGGRKRYSQPVAAFYVDDVEGVPFEDGALMLTAEADTHDTPAKVTGRGGKGTTSSPTVDVDAIVAAAVAQALAAAGVGQPQPPVQHVQSPPMPAPVGRGKVTSTRKPRPSTSKATTNGNGADKATSAEQLLGILNDA